MNRNILLIVWVVSAFFPFVTSVYAHTNVSSFGRETPVSIADFCPHLTGEEYYSEQWSHGVWDKHGRHFIGVDFIVSNIGIGDHKGSFKAEFTRKDNKKIKCQADFDSDEWSYTNKGFGLKFKQGEISGNMEGLKIRVRCKNLAMDLEFTNQTLPVRPGSGTLVYGKGDDTYNMVFTCPRARVTGSVQIDNETIQVNGIGHADHSWTNLAPHKEVRRWFRFNKVTEDLSIIMSEKQVPATYGGSRHGWVLVISPEERLLATSSVRFDFDAFIKDTNSKQGYTIPRKVKIMAVDGTNSLTGDLVMTKVVKIVDPTADWGMFVRFVAHRFSKPKDYHIDCKYVFTIRTPSGERSITGEAGYRFFYINP